MGGDVSIEQYEERIRKLEKRILELEQKVFINIDDRNIINKFRTIDNTNQIENAYDFIKIDSS